MGFFRQAVSDSEGVPDIAYVVIGIMAVAAISSLIFIMGMSVYDYSTCQPQTTITKGPEGLASIVPCRFDPLPIGQAAGLIFGAFGVLIGSLAGYMAATRRRENSMGRSESSKA